MAYRRPSKAINLRLHRVFRGAMKPHLERIIGISDAQNHDPQSLDVWGEGGLLRVETGRILVRSMPKDIRDDLWQMARFANDAWWQVQCTSTVLHGFYLSLKYRRGGFIKSHVDFDRWDRDCVKLTALVMLNDSFSGGGLTIAGKPVDLRPGDVAVFPGYVPHHVDPVANGIRRVLSAWYVGNKFR